ncbi:MAG: iron-containing alcohol dehydrogenase, partial [Lachnospiraceae bacterium]|nr:iron-containing alcohol dehydrogenase [Lachnospiraceae bacterium]
VIRNIRVLLNDAQNMEARSELAWASSMAENGILKIGKVTDFECHQMEHQLGAYTNCNHGAGLAVLHPVYYRHIYQSGLEKFDRFAEKVWDISPEGKTVEELARAGIEALEGFIREIGLPTTLRELGVDEQTDLKAIADSCNCVPGAYKKMTHKEILEIFQECY